MQSFERFFSPRGIAVIGASADASRPGAQTIGALRQRGYAGAIYPINPKYPEIQALPTYARIEDVPDPCDVAVIAVPAAQVPDMVAACGRRGVPFAVVLGGGFRESGPEGQALETRLKQAARDSGVRVLGPNCLGFVNLPEKVYAGFGSMVRPPLPPAGQVSAVVQSGGFGNSLVMRCAAVGIGFRYVLASGNEADISAVELLSACVDDPHTRVIIAYLEGVSDGRAFMDVARRALSAGKPLLVWKAGNTRQGLRAAASHTANMTGSYDIFRAAFRQCGVIELRDVDDIADYVRALLGRQQALAGDGAASGNVVSGKAASGHAASSDAASGDAASASGQAARAAAFVGRNVVVMGGSGGSAVVFSDAADIHGLTLATLAPETRRILGECLPGIAGLDNPIDFAAGFLGKDNEDRFLRALDAVLADPSVDQLGLMLATVVGERGESAARLLAQAAARHGKPVFVFWAAPPDTVGDAYGILARADIPVMTSPNRVAAAMGVLADYADARARVTLAAPRASASHVSRAGTSTAPPATGPSMPPAHVPTAIRAPSSPIAPPIAWDLPSFTGTLDEAHSKQLIAAFGIPVTKDRLLPPTPPEPGDLDNLPYPVALKIVSSDIAHKSDVGGVRLGIPDSQALRDAARTMLAEVARAAPGARLTGLLACQMAIDGLETIVGVVRDEVFGPVVALGMGGIHAESLCDMTYRIAPFGLDSARAMLGELRSAALFAAARGRPARDTEALARALVAVSELAWTMRDRVAELDINPLLVMAEGQGVVAADALAVLRD